MLTTGKLKRTGKRLIKRLRTPWLAKRPIFDIMATTNEFNHTIGSVLRILFRCLKIRWRHPLLRNRQNEFSKTGPTYFPCGEKGLNSLKLKQLENDTLKGILVGRRCFVERFNPNWVPEKNYEKNVKKWAIFSYFFFRGLNTSNWSAPKRDPPTTVNNQR